MTNSLNLKQVDIFTALRAYILQVLPTSIDVLRGQFSRVAQPIGPDYAIMTPLSKTRLSTTIDTYADCLFSGSITGNQLTVGSMTFGIVEVGNQVFGTGVVFGTTISGLVSGTGGVGTYIVSTQQTAGSQVMAAGVMFSLQPVEVKVQLDIYGPNAEDNMQMLTTLWRDEYAINFFAQVTGSTTPVNFQRGFPPYAPQDNAYIGISPLYADDVRQVGFQDAEQQWEFRYTCDFAMQANQIVLVSEEFAGDVDVTIKVPADLQ